MAPSNTGKPIVVETFTERLEAWYERNGKSILIVVGIALALYFGYRIFKSSQVKKTETANVAYGKALDNYRQGLADPEEATGKEKLSAAITGAREVNSEYGTLPVGLEAQLLAANAQYKLALLESGQEGADAHLEKARDEFTKYINQASGSKKAAGYLGLGNVLENLSFIKSNESLMTEAVEAYREALAASEGTFLADEVRVSLARALSGMNSPAAQEEAKKLYETVAKKEIGNLVSPDSFKNLDNATRVEGVTRDEVVDFLSQKDATYKKLAEDSLHRLK